MRTILAMHSEKKFAQVAFYLIIFIGIDSFVHLCYVFVFSCQFSSCALCVWPTEKSGGIVGYALETLRRVHYSCHRHHQP